MDLAKLEPGQIIAVEALSPTDAKCAAYRDSVGGATAMAHTAGRVPSMAIAAWALESVMSAVELPQGAVHIGQELEFMHSAHPGADLRCTTTVGQNTVRRGVRFLVIELKVTENGAPTLKGNATITIKEDSS